MMKERLAELLSRKLSGEATADELQGLEDWLQTHPDDQYFSDMLFNYWNSYHVVSPVVETSSDQHFAHILEMAAEQEHLPVTLWPQKGSIVRLMKRMAAAVCIVCVVGFPVWLLAKKKQVVLPATQNEVVASKGARSKIILPDGTQVWLNSDSKIQYAPTFNDTVREVTLDGEAYFDVVKNPRRPFIVHTSSIDIRVLGTAFNVKSYAQDKTIETTLIHGAVEISNKEMPHQARIILRPKEKLIFNKPATFIEKGNASAPVNIRDEKTTTGISIVALPRNLADTSLTETSWIYNRLIFEGDTFNELAVKMERWFNVKIRFKDDKLDSYRLRGVFEEENVEEALKALQLIVPFNYKIENNEIEITK